MCTRLKTGLVVESLWLFPYIGGPFGGGPHITTRSPCYVGVHIMAPDLGNSHTSKQLLIELLAAERLDFCKLFRKIGLFVCRFAKKELPVCMCM